MLIVWVLLLCACLKWHCLVEVFFHNTSHVPATSLDCELNLYRLPKLAPDDVTIVVQLIEVFNFEVVIDLFIKDSLQFEALVLQHTNILLFLVVHVQIIELNPTSAELLTKLIFLNVYRLLLLDLELPNRQQWLFVE